MKTVLVAAITADGFIGRTSDHLADWTGKADKKLFVEVTKQAGIMVMGSKTFATIGRALPGRRTIVLTSRPESVTAEGVETSAETPQQLVARLQAEGAHGLAVVGGASVYRQFVEAGVVDELYLTVTPLLFGTGVPLLGNELAIKLALLDTATLDEDTVLLHYKVLKDTAGPQTETVN